MNENIYERELRLPFEFIPKLDGYNELFSHNSFNLECINDEFAQWLTSKKLAIAHAETFCLSPLRAPYVPIHVDIVHPEQSDHVVKINFVFSKHDSYMNWYELKSNTDTVILDTPVDSKYRYIRREDAKLVHTVKTDRPRLVNAGIPHDVYPSVQSKRHSFCFVLKHLYTHEKVSWNEALEILRDCIVA